MTKSSNKSGKKTVELPAVTPEDIPEAASSTGETAPVEASNPHQTRELKAIRPADVTEETSAADERDPQADVVSAMPQDEDESGPSAEMSGPAAAVQADGADDLAATVLRSAVEPPPAERPRHNTLASIARPRGSTNPNGAPPPEPEPLAFQEEIIPDETEGAASGEDEWAVADQPTVSLSPGSVLSARPQFLDTGEQSSWPPRHAEELPEPSSLPEAAASLHRRAVPRLDRTGLRRYASPTGRPMPNVPSGDVPPTAYPNPRMQRYQELHRRRDAAQNGEQAPRSDKQVTERVRQWWSDLRPGLKQALDYQHEARASGVLPIPAHDPAPSSRLGDVFGRLTASARGLTGRAQSAAAPALKKLHDQAEQAAQAIVGRFDDPARQQAPFLGPGRIAVFFRSGVSVGQAQRLLSSNEARPLRMIPRKHGFLAYVLPGTEERVSTRLRVHPYVRDVIFMPVNAYGDPLDHEAGR